MELELLLLVLFFGADVPLRYVFPVENFKARTFYLDAV
jgi:hypothetical protein